MALSRAGYLLLPSLWHENAPVTIIEAAAYGLGMIASNIGGIPEFVEANATGMLLPPGDVCGAGPFDGTHDAAMRHPCPICRALATAWRSASASTAWSMHMRRSTRNWPVADPCGNGGMRFAAAPFSCSALSRRRGRSRCLMTAIVDVRDHGARGDGQQDDTNAILAAIDAASGGDTGRSFWHDRLVYLPDGTYLVSDTLLKRYATAASARA